LTGALTKKKWHFRVALICSAVLEHYGQEQLFSVAAVAFLGAPPCQPASQRFDENQNSAVQAARFQKQLHTQKSEGSN
jgi:hypothetical protein